MNLEDISICLISLFLQLRFSFTHVTFHKIILTLFCTALIWGQRNVLCHFGRVVSTTTGLLWDGSLFLTHLFRLLPKDCSCTVNFFFSSQFIL